MVGARCDLIEKSDVNEELNDILHEYSANLWNMNLIVITHCNSELFV